MIELEMHQVDAFTDRVFGGNPAAVLLLENWLDEATMQAIARENNLSETAFVVPEADRFRIRWFTPAVEVELCGHATLAAAHVLFAKGLAPGDAIAFASRSGTLGVTREGDRLVLDFPADPPEPVEPGPDFAEALGDAPAEWWRGRYHLAVFGGTAEVRALAPDMQRLARLDAYAVVATAPGEHCDFVSRFFGPRVGVPEDPVTGSAHCLLTPYWALRLGRTSLHARQVSARGGELWCELSGDRVRIGGHAVTFLSGRIRIPL